MATEHRVRTVLRWVVIPSGGVVRYLDVQYLAPDDDDKPEGQWALQLEGVGELLYISAEEAKLIVNALMSGRLEPGQRSVHLTGADDQHGPNF